MESYPVGSIGHRHGIGRRSLASATHSSAADSQPTPPTLAAFSGSAPEASSVAAFAGAASAARAHPSGEAPTTEIAGAKYIRMESTDLEEWVMIRAVLPRQLGPCQHRSRNDNSQCDEQRKTRKPTRGSKCHLLTARSLGIRNRADSTDSGTEYEVMQ